MKLTLKGEIFVQQGRWAHRLYLLKDRLQHQGMFPTLVIYYHRIRSMLFSRYTFGRWGFPSIMTDTIKNNYSV